MKQLNEFLIPFIGLKLGKHQFDYQINKTFFAIFDYDEFETAAIEVTAVLEKKAAFMELHLSHNGSIHVACDTTNEMFDLPINGKMRLIVQFGDAFNDDNDELLILQHGEHQIDISQYVYEMIALSVPLKKEHPGINDGSLQSETLDKLNQIRVKETKIETKQQEIDPRWDKLKQLLTDK